jgi:pyruvate/2-oxoglutarate dehydrogenase complex dihydrolipoamide dehydrogenase (E3) component
VAAEYDLIVVGGGAAGLGAAGTAAGMGARTLLVAEGEIGGECTFTGCVPSKALIEAAARGTCFADAMAAVRTAVAGIAATETPEVLRGQGIGVLRGRAVFTAPRVITVGGRALCARSVIIATGSVPAVPPLPGLAPARSGEAAAYLTNETVFTLPDLPASLAVLGGGATGCELAQAFRRLGSQVTVLEAAPRLLPAADPEASAVIGRVFAAEGIAVRTSAEVKDVQPNGHGVSVILPGGERLTAERLLVAAGRAPAAGHLGLEATGVAVDGRGRIRVNAHLATTAEGVYAAGDVTGLMPFTHAAYAMGRLAARNALHGRLTPPGTFTAAAIPWVVFTSPEVAQVGLTEDQAAARPGARVAFLPASEIDRAVTAGRTEGFVQIIAGPRPLLRGGPTSRAWPA